MNRRKKVVFYTENYVYGGLERYLFDAIGALAEDWDAALLHNDYPGFAARFAAEVRRPARRVPVPIATRPRRIDRLARVMPRLAARAVARAFAVPLARHDYERNRAAIAAALREIGPADVLHVVNGGYPGGESCAAAARAAAEAGVPRRVYSVLSVHQPEVSRPPAKAIEKRLLEDVHAFVTNSAAGRDSLLRHRGFPPSAVVVARNGVGVPRVDAARAAALRREWLGDGTLLVGCLGALYPLKGHRCLIEALPAVLRAHPRARLVLVGDGESAADLRAQARALGVEESVLFPGYLEGDPGDALAAFDVFAHPTSQIEGLPYAILEAMALGKPVLATAVGGVPEAVADGVTGLLVPPASPAALAEALSRLVDPGLRRRLGEAARRRWSEEFTAEAAAARLRALYEPAAAEPSR